MTNENPNTDLLTTMFYLEEVNMVLLQAVSEVLREHGVPEDAVVKKLRSKLVN